MQIANYNNNVLIILKTNNNSNASFILKKKHLSNLKIWLQKLLVINNKTDVIIIFIKKRPSTTSILESSI